VIARIWRGAVRSGEAQEYADYIDATGVKEYTETDGNRGVWMLRRDRDDGVSEFVMFTLWDSMDAVRAFAGDAPEKAVYYPEDERFLVEHDDVVEHYEVVGSAEAGSLPGR
jgi:heme-degrading monooxygenase HmoA